MSLLRIFSPSILKDRLIKTSGKISTHLTQIFTHKKLDTAFLEELEELLIASDMGVEAAAHIIAGLADKKFNKQISDSEVREMLVQEITTILLPCQKNLQITEGSKPQVIIFNGVNGTGKTTSIGKLAYLLNKQGKKVMIAACDTFRAAASEQLKIWAQRANCPIVEAQRDNEDPASVAYRALIKAREDSFDVLLVDTAGRLQNKQYLMDELKKINQVIKKIDNSAPHENILVLDATTGQNARNQLDIFDRAVNVSGIIITKLDGSAKGGIVLSLAAVNRKPIYAIGVGEQITDLQEFDAKSFARALVGLQ